MAEQIVLLIIEGKYEDKFDNADASFHGYVSFSTIIQ